MSEQERLMRQISAYQFCMGIAYILDTHPNNCEAAKRLRRSTGKGCGID